MKYEYNYKNRNNYIKILAILSFSIIFIILNMIKISPAIGYEISIFSPILYIWILLIITVICGIVISIDQAYSKEKRYWQIGFFIIILSIFIATSMPALRGYYLYGYGDAQVHLREVRFIVDTGHIFGYLKENFYPTTHILIAEIAEMTKIYPLQIGRYISGIFTIFFMLYIYCLANVVLQNKESKIIATVCSGTLFFSFYHLMVYPQILSTLYIPLFFYFYAKNDKFSDFLVPIIIVLLVLPFFHPLSMVMVILFLLIMGLKIDFLKFFKKNNSVQIKKVEFKKVEYNLLLISIIIFFSWLSIFAIFGSSIDSIVHKEENYQLPQIEKAIGYASTFDLVSLTLRRYTDNIIYILLSLVGGIILMKKIRFENDLNFLFKLFIWFLASGGSIFALFLVIHQIYINRVLDAFYPMIVSPVLVGFALFELFEKIKYKIFISIIISFLFVISLLGTYNSPWIMQPSWHVTYQDINGVIWLSKGYNKPLTIETMGINSEFIGVAGIEHNIGELRTVDANYITKERKIPDEFNYSLYENLGNIFEKDTYLITEIRASLAANNPILNKTRLSTSIPWGRSDDLDKMENDTTINKIYANNELKIWYIKAQLYES